MDLPPKQARENLVSLPFIDGLRGIAILAVMADHLFVQGIGGEGAKLAGSFTFFMALGQRGVQLFFLVSAFTLYASYSRRAGQERNPARNFYIRRAFRILPLWWASMLLFAWLRNRFTLGDLLPNIFMYFGFYRFSGVEIGGWQWSIFVEESFYAIFPLVVVRLTSLRRALAFFVATYSVSYVWLRAAPLLGLEDTLYFISWFPLNHWYSFAMGIVLFFVWRDPSMQRQVFEDKTARRWLYLACVVALMEGFTKASDRGMLSMTAFFLMSFHDRSPVGWLCRTRLVRQFGRCCYSLYLFHMLSMEWLRDLPITKLLPWTLPAEVNFLLLFPAVALVNLGAAKLLFVLAEKPTIAWGSSLIRRIESKDQSKPNAPHIKAA